MSKHLRACSWMLALSMLLSCIIYPGLLLVIGQTFFRQKAEGGLVLDKDGKPVGSRLIAQPFTADEYFQPRPSAASYNGGASAGTNWGANNYLLRDRVARQLGPIVKYGSGPKKGQPVAPDIESWFQKDQLQGKPGIVAQWAQAHPTLAANWVKADKGNGEYVAEWQKGHAQEVAAWVKDNPDNPQPKPEDLAVVFFTSYSTSNPGSFPGPVEHKSAGGKIEKKIEPLKAGSDIQSIFFDLWRQDHPGEELELVPA